MPGRARVFFEKKSPTEDWNLHYNLPYLSQSVVRRCQPSVAAIYGLEARTPLTSIDSSYTNYFDTGLPSPESPNTRSMEIPQFGSRCSSSSYPDYDLYHYDSRRPLAPNPYAEAPPHQSHAAQSEAWQNPPQLQYHAPQYAPPPPQQEWNPSSQDRVYYGGHHEQNPYDQFPIMPTPTHGYEMAPSLPSPSFAWASSQPVLNDQSRGSISHEMAHQILTPPGPTLELPPSRSLAERPETATPFISKLSLILSTKEFAPYIRWTADGKSFVFAHASDKLLEIFARFFRHSNSHSFVRQLNIYGFSRLTTLKMLAAIESAQHPEGASVTASDYSAFTHPDFYRPSPENPCILAKLKPKSVQKKKDRGPPSPVGSGSRGRRRSHPSR